MQVTAFKAKDGSLHEKKVDQQLVDNQMSIKAGIKMLAGDLLGAAPHKDDWQCRALADEEETEEALLSAFDANVEVLRSLLHRYDERETLNAEKNRPMVAVQPKAKAAKTVAKKNPKVRS